MNCIKDQMPYKRPFLGHADMPPRQALVYPGQRNPGMPGAGSYKRHDLEHWGADYRHHYASGKTLLADIYVCRRCGQEVFRFIKEEASDE